MAAFTLGPQWGRDVCFLVGSEKFFAVFRSLNASLQRQEKLRMLVQKRTLQFSMHTDGDFLVVCCKNVSTGSLTVTVQCPLTEGSKVSFFNRLTEICRWMLDHYIH